MRLLILILMVAGVASCAPTESLTTCRGAVVWANPTMWQPPAGPVK